MSIEPFPVLDVSGWDIVADETSGAEEKYWLQEPGDDGTLWLFKAVTVKEDHVHGEDWSEKAVSHLAGLLGVPCARVELAVLDDLTGCISANLCPKEHELKHGQELLQDGVPGYIHGKGRVHPGHNLENIRTSLIGALPPPGCRLPFTATAYDVFAGYVLLDAWVANRDRHANNWAVLRPVLEPDGPLRLCGSYDHASSLGFNVMDHKRAQLLSEHRIEAWCEKGLAQRFDYDRGTTLVQLAARGLRLASSDARSYWFEKMRNISEDDVRNIIVRVPRMSDPARTFAETVLDVNRRRILDDCA